MTITMTLTVESKQPMEIDNFCDLWKLGVSAEQVSGE